MRSAVGPADGMGAGARSSMTAPMPTATTRRAPTPASAAKSCQPGHRTANGMRRRARRGAATGERRASGLQRGADARGHRGGHVGGRGSSVPRRPDRGGPGPERASSLRRPGSVRTRWRSRAAVASSSRPACRSASSSSVIGSGRLASLAVVHRCPQRGTVPRPMQASLRHGRLDRAGPPAVPS